MIECHLLGSPTIIEDDKNIFIPNGKISAFLYYLLIKKVVSRDEVAGMFWGNSNDEKAKISLRNALHKLKKTFSYDLILTPNKSTIILNKEVDIRIDVEDFEDNPIENLYFYKGEFLKGFYVKDSVDFDYFVTQNRTRYEEMFVNASVDSINDDLRQSNLDDVEIKVSNLIAVDIYNESAYILMMKYYKSIGRYDKLINEYHNFKRIIEDEIGIELSEEANKLYSEALKKVEKSKKPKKSMVDDIYKREYEISEIEKILDDFEKGEDAFSILLRGESGIGKTTLKKQIIGRNNDRFYIFESNCYHIEKDFILSPWIKIISCIDHELRKNDIVPIFWEDMISKLFHSRKEEILPVSKILENRENFSLEIINNAIIQGIRELNKTKKTIISIEDIQFCDEYSLNLIINIILHFAESVIFLLTASKERISRLENAIVSLKYAKKLKILDLERFSKKDVSIIVKKLLGTEGITNNDIQYIYEKSEGNALFLNEYINLYRNNNKDGDFIDKLGDLLDEKISFLDEHELTVAKALSIFYGEIELDTLIELLDENVFSILKTLNSLQDRNIVEEYKIKNNTYIRFYHSIYKDYLHTKLSMSEKQLLNARLADIFERKILSKNDLTLYIKLRYHYEQAGNEMKTLKYDVYIWNYHLNYNHEVFPDLNDYDLSKQVRLYIKNDKAMNIISDLERHILMVKNQIKNRQDKAHMDNIELMFLYCKGRYLIRGGVYTDGIATMEKVIEISKTLNMESMLISGYKQMVIYGIQISDVSVMIKYIIPAMKVCKAAKLYEDLGVFNRLYGLYHLMQGNTRQAEEMFFKAINIFSDSGMLVSQNSISIAASYNYIGEIRKSCGMYKEAMQYFEKAIDLCKNNGVTCLAIFYINAGKTLFLEGDLKKSKKYFFMAKDIAKEFDSYWKSAVIDAFLALFYFLENNYDATVDSLNKSMYSVKTIHNHRDIGMIYFVQTIIASNMDDKKKKLGNIKLLLNHPSEVYFYKALKHLDTCRDAREIKYLEEIYNGNSK